MICFVLFVYFVLFVVLGLATGIQIPHDDTKNLSRDSRVALGHGHVRL